MAGTASCSPIIYNFQNIENHEFPLYRRITFCSCSMDKWTQQREFDIFEIHTNLKSVVSVFMLHLGAVACRIQAAATIGRKNITKVFLIERLIEAIHEKFHCFSFNTFFFCNVVVFRLVVLKKNPKKKWNWNYCHLSIIGEYTAQ